MALNHEELPPSMESADNANLGRAVTNDIAELNRLLQATLDDCALALFNDDTSLTICCGARFEEPGLVGSIGFVGAMMRGVLTWELSIATARASSGRDDVTDVCDWVGEMTNQLLGRIKNKLLGHGLELLLSTPTVIYGCTVDAPPRVGDRIRSGLASDRGKVRAVFEYVASDALAFTVEASAGAADEGSAFFF